MEEFKSNSHRSREDAKETKAAPEKKIERVVSGSVKTKKKGEFHKLMSSFFPEDMDMKTYILSEFLIPGIKKGIEEIVHVCFWGERSDRRDSRRLPASRVSYRSYYEREDDRRKDYSTTSSRLRNGYDYDDVIIPSRKDAEEVLLRMDELIDTYGIISVADFYEMVGVTGSWTDNKYGWTDIRDATVIKVRDGWVIKLPRAVAIT